MKKMLKVMTLSSLMIGLCGVVTGMEQKTVLGNQKQQEVSSFVPGRGVWSREYACQIKKNYPKLHDYLNGCLEANVGTDIAACFDWITEKSDNGDILCMYYKLRSISNDLKVGKPLGTEEVSNILALIVKFLARIALDMILVEYCCGDPVAQDNAYELLLTKLSKYFIPPDKRHQFGKIVVSNAVAITDTWFSDLSEKYFRSPLWVLNVKWANPLLGQAIVFSDCSEKLIKASDRKEKDVASKIHSLIIRSLILSKIFDWYNSNCKNIDDLLSKNPLADRDYVLKILEGLDKLLPESEEIDSDDEDFGPQKMRHRTFYGNEVENQKELVPHANLTEDLASLKIEDDSFEDLKFQEEKEDPSMLVVTNSSNVSSEKVVTCQPKGQTFDSAHHDDASN